MITLEDIKQIEKESELYYYKVKPCRLILNQARQCYRTSRIDECKSCIVSIMNNLFENCNGEIEMISVKSSENIIYQNTITNCKATITLRHGQGSIIAKNKFLQSNMKKLLIFFGLLMMSISSGATITAGKVPIC